MNFSLVSTTIIELGIIMFLGFFVAKTGYISHKFKDALSKLIVNLILPCLIITSISSKEYNSELLVELGIDLLISLFCIITLYITGVITAKIFRIPEPTATVHKLLSVLGNAIFIGYPVIVAMYGEEGFFWVIPYWLLNDTFLWTVGVFMFSKKEKNTAKRLKKLINPNTIAFIIAIVMFIYGVKLPNILHSALTDIGSLTVPLSMIFIGMALSTVELKKILTKWWILILLPLKLVVMPVAFIFLFRYLPVRDIILGVIIIETALPSQTILSIVAKEYNSDYEYAASSLFITTLLSLVTLPYICSLIEKYLH